MLSAPRGVTSTAGAKAYATKFAISPTITEERDNIVGADSLKTDK
jgi:hypothetical protein